ncbi:hypothetical protein VB711_06625 [Cronbergia sp. UHCC 0137]|uniref:nucleotidyltransferase family protein n=1 Tax=Cronbergia sp. UHCC 0137 TaxID=3110239 RepID=UPI002B208C5A|nr:hypothetical protein [Cronbergia sp. UHCC 0137]MEA5617512.1 hypothetical protein [Cronbergia sp. UHCC 0137]
MPNIVLTNILQQLESLTSNEKKILAEHLTSLNSDENQSVIIRSRLKIIQANKAEILQLSSRYGASNIRYFTLEEFSKDEVNFLVDLEENRSLFDLGGLLMDLRELLGFDVVVFTKTTLKDDYQEQVLQNAIQLERSPSPQI